MSQLTILVPIYNEEESLLKFRESMDSFLNQVPFETRVLLINDGSTDKSFAIIRSIVREDNRYASISLLTNSGLSAALKAGINYADSPWIGYIDADLQTSPMDFMTYLQYMPEYDMITGIRVNRHDSLIKKISSRIANAVRGKILQDGIADTCCPLKLFRSDSIRQVPFFKGMHRFLPALVQLQGGLVKQVPVRHFARTAGTSKYNLGNRLLGPFLDMLAFLWMKKRNLKFTVVDREMTPSYNRDLETA